MEKETEIKKNKFRYKNELEGILIILICVIGLGRFGFIGELISDIHIFLSGKLYNILMISLIVVGLFIILKKNKFEYFKFRLLGIALIVISILTLNHLVYIETSNLKGFLAILGDVFKNLKTYTKTLSLVEGGGLIGAFFSWLFILLFSLKGTKIVLWTLLLSGVIITFNLSIIEFFKYIISKLKPKVEIEEPETVVEEVTSDDEEYVAKQVDSDYQLPPLTLLDDDKKKNKESSSQIKENINILETVLQDFDIKGKVVEVHSGPSVTQYELEIKAGTKVNRILNINKEIALVLAAKHVRIQAPIPGKRTIGIEIPNKINSLVVVKEILNNIPKHLNKSLLTVALGKDIMGKSVYTDLSAMPHLLIAGATGSGKSVCINTIITSILIRCRPDEVELVLIDPKKVELSHYNGIPHLRTPVVTSPKAASGILKKIVVEMENRYSLFEAAGAKNMNSYNQILIKRKEDEKVLPYIVVIIDELADLMLVAAKEVEDSIMRITQMARAAGIHLIVATQRPSTDVITGIIKANIPSRISFAVSSNVDSRTILDMSGAEKLLGQGDMLFLPMGESIPIRIQGAYIKEEEIKRIVKWVSKEQKPDYDESFEKIETISFRQEEEEEDEMYSEIKEYVLGEKTISISKIQRVYRVGYNRASRIMDSLEKEGLVGMQVGSKPRDVLPNKEN